jgi:Ser/Thr protein kinase RdoA (MazF antagonist)
VLNWGGFVSHSYRVGDGRRSVHVKLATTTDQGGMRRWLAVHDRLEADYHAPPVLASVDLPGTPFGGLVFEHIEGEPWDTAGHPALLGELVVLLGRLHEDRPLAERLGDGPRGYRECWELRYREQFEEDLKTVRACRPSSVTDARVSWMEEEARVVLGLPSGNEAFDGVTRSPCHWDLWPDNVLVGADGRFWVLDWDGLAAGDEAEDLATLVWPFVHATGEDWRDLLGGEEDGPFAARMDLHIRAIALDYLIDVLADWADCDVPEWRDAVRRRKEEEHHRYLDWYLNRWGEP